MWQVYKTLSLGVDLIKSEVNLKARLNVSVTLSIEDVFKGTVPCAYATPTSTGLLKHFIQFSEKTRKGKGVF